MRLIAIKYLNRLTALKDIVVGRSLGQQWLAASWGGVVTYVLATGVAVLGVEGLEAVAAVRASVLHDVPLASERDLALEAAEVLHVPVPALRLRALVSKDDLHRVQYKVY